MEEGGHRNADCWGCRSISRASRPGLSQLSKALGEDRAHRNLCRVWLVWLFWTSRFGHLVTVRVRGAPGSLRRFCSPLTFRGLYASPQFGSQMPRHQISGAHEWINEIPTVPIYYLAKPQPREWTWEDQRGKKTLLSLTLVFFCKGAFLA